jgi:hypothetical protein
MSKLKFENLPSAVAELQKGQSEIIALLHNKANSAPEIEKPLDIKELSIFIKKTVPTIYGYCQRNEIPFSRKGNRLYFFKSKIIDWLKESKVKTIVEIEEEASAYLLKKNKAV